MIERKEYEKERKRERERERERVKRKKERQVYRLTERYTCISKVMIE